MKIQPEQQTIKAGKVLLKNFPVRTPGKEKAAGRAGAQYSGFLENYFIRV